MDNFIELFKDLGYWIVLLGSIIEGESIILPACIFAYKGYLSITKVALIAFFGTLVADQALYNVGRYYGHRIIERYPKFKEPSKRAFKLLHQWDYKFILSFRFIYGIRFISPIVVGAAHYPPRKYVPLNIIAALIWTILSCTLGYFLGSVIDIVGFAVIEKYMFAFSLFLLVFVIVAGYFAWRKLRPSPTIPPEPSMPEENMKKASFPTSPEK